MVFREILSLLAFVLAFNGEWIASILGAGYSSTSAFQKLIYFVLAVVAIYSFFIKKNSVPVVILALFLIAFAFSLVNVFNSNSIFAQFTFIVSLLKGVLVGAGLHFLISNSPTGDGISRVFKAMLLIQVVVVCFQVFLPEETFYLWAPTQPVVGSRVAASVDLWDGSSFGLFPTQIGLAYFCLVTLVIVEQCFSLRRRNNTILVATGFCIFSSFSIATTICYALYFLVTRAGLRLSILIISICTLASLAFIRESLFISGLPVDVYIDVARDNRLGIIFETLPKFFRSDISYIFFGYGYNGSQLFDFLVSGPAPPMIFVHDDEATALQDVYHIAILIQFGLAGLATYLYTYFICFNFAKGLSDRHRTTLYWLLAFSLILGFFNQVWNVSSFSVLFFFMIFYYRKVSMFSSMDSR